MIQAIRPQRSQMLPLASLAYAGALGVAILAVLTKGESEPETWLIVAPPLIAAVLAVATARRDFVWLATGACFALGLMSIFSIGIFVLQIVLCLLLWWSGTPRRGQQPRVTWPDLLWLNLGFFAFMAPLLGFSW
jgi:hypothetical protein